MPNRCVAAVVAVLLVASSALAAEGAAGKWTWTFKRPDGKEVTSVLTLKQEGDGKLTGVSKLDTGEEHPIENGKLVGDTVSFSITRERDGQKVTANYSGKLTADAITGKVTSKRGDREMSSNWKATRVKE